jgi:hypothetical protein
MYARRSLVVIFSLLSVLSGAAQKKLNFLRLTWYEAVSEAERSDKFLFFYISQPGCAYCREFDKVTLMKLEIRELLQSRFVLVKHSVATPYGEAFARDFHLTHTPAVLLLKPKKSGKPDVFGEIYDEGGFLKALKNWIDEY